MEARGNIVIADAYLNNGSAVDASSKLRTPATIDVQARIRSITANSSRCSVCDPAGSLSGEAALKPVAGPVLVVDFELHEVTSA